ncbi:MAG: hypothetical protein CM15mV16_1190 [uncultured marine virus]|nr:MAG: hypothetical protein CM15mV16_1190 [uncultured marine virus]
MNAFDNDFVRKMYKENCKERIAYGEKPYDDINYYECKLSVFGRKIQRRE